MSSNTSLEEKIEQLMKLSAEKDAQLEYLRMQLDQAMRNNRREIRSSHSMKNGPRPSCVDILFNKGSPKSHHTSSLPTMPPLKEIIFYEGEEVNEVEEDLNRLDPPPIFDDYGDEELLEFEELGETTTPSSSCEEEGQLCKEELHLSLYKDVHHEDNEIILDLPPRFDEHEDGQGSCEILIISGGPQNFELKQEVIVQGFEWCSTQGGCPYFQQELRTILFQQRESDAHLLGYHIQPCSSDVHFQGNVFYPLNSTSREVSFIQIHAWHGSSLVSLFEFHDKRHLMKFYSNFKVPFPKGFPNEDRKCNAFQRE